MNVLHNVTAIFRSPDAAVLASQAVQGADLAARQAAETLRRETDRKRELVAPGETLSPGEAVGERRLRDEESRRRTRRHEGTETAGRPAVDRRHIDITA